MALTDATPIERIPGQRVNQQMMVPDGVSLGWFDQPVLLSHVAPYRIAQAAASSVRDDVLAFLDACASNGIAGVLMPGTYEIGDRIEAPGGLQLVGHGATLKATDPDLNSSLLYFLQKDHITIRGLTIDGNRSAALASSEFQHGIALYACTNVLIDEVDFSECNGDGGYLGSYGTPEIREHCENITFQNCSFHHNSRNNLSIVAGERLRFLNCHFDDALGEAPESGVDIEPNLDNDVIDDIVFAHCTFNRNHQRGSVVSLRNAPTVTQGNIRFIACEASDNYATTGGRAPGFQVIAGRGVTYIGCTANRNTNRGLLIGGASTDVISDVTWIGGEIRDNGLDGVSSQSGIITNVVIENALIENNGTFAAETYAGIRFGPTSGSVTGARASGNRIRGQHRGIQTTTAASQITIGPANDVRDNTLPITLADDSATRIITPDNRGYKTAANGTATVTAAATSVTVPHGLGATPALKDIKVTPTNNLGTATKYWISNLTSTLFTINVDVAPGAGTATFVWEAVIR